MSAIVHLVMWKLNGASVPERQAQGQLAVQAFEALRGQVPGLLRMEVGGNVIEADDAWDLALSMVFASRSALEAYNTHPAHQAIKVLMRPMRQSRAQVDFETSS
jgi:hypothetical protein